MTIETSPAWLDPIYFAEKVLGVECWSKMREIMQAITDGKRKILVRSCNGAGKTTAIAALCNWKLANFEESIVLTTASSWIQVRRTLWGEIRKQARRSELYSPKAIGQTDIKISDKHYALGISPSMPENAQGFHAPSMLIAVDEATGVSREIIDALSGNATSSDTQMILICNPINTHSFPYEAEESGEWHLITISALEHPNVVTGREVIHGAVTRKWIEDRLRSWSHVVDPHSRKSVYIPWLDTWFKKTALVQSRILGEWADNDSEGFITMDLIQRSLEVQPAPGLKTMGVDIARGGSDETVFSFFDGNAQLPFETFYHETLMQTAERIQAKYEQGWRIIALDDTGLGGGVSDRLKQFGVPHYPIAFSQRARGFLKNRKELANARAEMYFTLEEELRDAEIRLLPDPLFHQELSALRLTTSENSTAYRMEDKDLLKKRLGRSPDRSDATALARYALRLHAHESKMRIW